MLAIGVLFSALLPVPGCRFPPETRQRRVGVFEGPPVHPPGILLLSKNSFKKTSK